MDPIATHLLSRYPGDFSRTVTVRENLERICRRHIELGLANRTFQQNLCSGDEGRFWQRLSEALLAHELLAAGLDIRPSSSGPDLLLKHEDRNVWIEVMCPEPAGIPSDWLEADVGVHTFPHEAILLRWTAAIKEKAEKLLGTPDGKRIGYIQKRVVRNTDAYVIAVNARRLRAKYFPALTGISQFPFAVEAVFAVGPSAITIDTRTGQSTPARHTHRPLIAKPVGSAVPAYTFLDSRFSPISAVWACDIDETWAIGNAKPSAVVHNPIAVNPIPVNLLPAVTDYVALPDGPDAYVLEKRARPT